MTDRKLVIDIRCGETACYEAPGRPCPYVRVGKFGQHWSCFLFQDNGECLDEENGWLQRHPECLRKESR